MHKYVKTKYSAVSVEQEVGQVHTHYNVNKKMKIKIIKKIKFNDIKNFDKNFLPN